MTWLQTIILAIATVGTAAWVIIHLYFRHRRLLTTRAVLAQFALKLAVQHPERSVAACVHAVMPAAPLHWQCWALVRIAQSARVLDHSPLQQMELRSYRRCDGKLRAVALTREAWIEVTA